MSSTSETTYRYYPNDSTGEYYKSGPIESMDERSRYDFLACRKWKGDSSIPEGPKDTYRFLTSADGLCSECQNSWLGEVVQLYLTPDSVNAELDRYMAGLPDLSDYPKPDRRAAQEAWNQYYWGLLLDIEIIFAEGNANLGEYQDVLDDLLNNFIKDKGRRYPNEDEFTRWLNRGELSRIVSHCKIFDLRGKNYINYEVVQRFVIIIHFKDSGGLWWQLWAPETTL